MRYGVLPMTGIGSITIGGVAVAHPVIALVAAGAVVAGFLILRFVKPNRLSVKGGDVS